MEEKEEGASKSQQDFYQAEEAQAEDAIQKTEQSEQHPEPDVDPDDPLFGLEQRLRNMNLDEESKRIIKEKLEEANNKIKTALEDRQKNLDNKLAGGIGSLTAKKK